MMPVLDPPPWGWYRPARGFLTLLASVLAVGLAWSSRDNRGQSGAIPSMVVDANSVPIPVLSALPGLGPVLAGRIVEARAISPFRSIEDFDRRVYGIGPAKVAALRPFLRFDLPPASPP